jgi:hypothetical protein
VGTARDSRTHTSSKGVYRRKQQKKKNIFTPPFYSAPFHFAFAGPPDAVRRIQRTREGRKRVECNATKEAAVGVTIYLPFFPMCVRDPLQNT